MILAPIAVALSLLVAPAPPLATYTQVVRVVDGDTFEVTGGAKVRVLGIDSCEMNTAGGVRAKEAAERLLLNQRVKLVREPSAPDTDRYGRLLRYVWANSRDFGTIMASADHTGVYGGRNDAAASYVTFLREQDRDGRACGGPPVAPASDHRYVPVPIVIDREHHGESRFCARRWWC